MEKSIFIIEDDTDLSSALKSMLEMEGFMVYSAEKAEMGLTILPEVKPDLLLLDLLTNSIHGIDFLERIRNDPEVADTKCIILTNSEHDGHEERAKELGVLNYLVKSKTSLAEVLEFVKKALAEK